MNKKKGLIIGGVAALAVVIIITFVIVLTNNGKGKDKNSKETTKDTTSIETTTEIESNTEKDTEQTTEEETTQEKTTEEETTKKPEEKDEPSEEQLAYREVLKNQIFEVGYDSYKEAYLHMLQVYRMAYEYGDVECSLVDYDGDDISELVVEVNSGITMYTYKAGKVYKLIDDWGYGAGGNHGYEYIPGKQAIRNYDTDYAGLIIYETYFEIELNGDEVVNNQKVLKKIFFDDVNNNGVPDDGENIGEEYASYYLDKNEITADKYSEFKAKDEYVMLSGALGLYQISEILEKPDLVKVSDAGCREAYLKTIDEFEHELRIRLELDDEEDISTSYALIDFNGDDTLELVCQIGACTISFYTYEDGKVYQLMDERGWGAGGNHGYEYIPGKNIYRNEDSDSGNHTTSYRKLNDNNELELMYYIVVEWGEYKKDEIDRYYKGTKDGEVEITEVEYMELIVEGNFRLIKGWYSREEIEDCLQ